MSSMPLTRIDWVEAQIRRAILDGELAPGERLIAATLSERFSVSPTPLREALQRLAGEGLVEFTAQRGARVAPLSPGDCLELAELRRLLEPETAVQAALAGDDGWRTRIRNASDALLEAWADPEHSPVASELAYRAFYEEAAEACPSTRLRHVTRVVREQSARYRLAVSQAVDRETVALGHRELVAALTDVDVPVVHSSIEREIKVFSAAYQESPFVTDGDGPAGDRG